MPEHRLPKQILYSDLTEGNRKRGGQKLCYKDTLKRNLKRCDIDPDTWEDLSKDRTKWREAVHESMTAVEDQRLQKYQKAHERRHNKPAPSALQCSCCKKFCRSNAGLVAHKRACAKRHVCTTYTYSESSFSLQLPLLSYNFPAPAKPSHSFKNSP